MRRSRALWSVPLLGMLVWTGCTNRVVEDAPPSPAVQQLASLRQRAEEALGGGARAWIVPGRAAAVQVTTSAAVEGEDALLEEMVDVLRFMGTDLIMDEMPDDSWIAVEILTPKASRLRLWQKGPWTWVTSQEDIGFEEAFQFLQSNYRFWQNGLGMSGPLPHWAELQVTMPRVLEDQLGAAAGQAAWMYIPGYGVLVDLPAVTDRPVGEVAQAVAGSLPASAQGLYVQGVTGGHLQAVEHSLSSGEARTYVDGVPADLDVAN